MGALLFWRPTPEQAENKYLDQLAACKIFLEGSPVFKTILETTPGKTLELALENRSCPHDPNGMLPFYEDFLEQLIKEVESLFVKVKTGKIIDEALVAEATDAVSKLPDVLAFKESILKHLSAQKKKVAGADEFIPTTIRFLIHSKDLSFIRKLATHPFLLKEGVGEEGYFFVSVLSSFYASFITD